MLEGISHDQLLTFIAVADEGSFSAAARRLRRDQSVISRTVSSLESHLDVLLFDRAARLPVLTDHGRALLISARAVTNQLDLFKARAKGLARGSESELTIVVDPVFPIATLVGATPAFREQFPETTLQVYAEPWRAVIQHVLDGRSTVGVIASLLNTPPHVARESLLEVRLGMVVSSKHPLARYRRVIPTETAAKYVQLVHTPPSDRLTGRDSGVLSPKPWLISPIEFKLEFVRAGLGFAILPFHMIERELVSGALVEIRVENSPRSFSYSYGLCAIYRADSPPGPAGRWLIDHVAQRNGRRSKANSGVPLDTFIRRHGRRGVRPRRH